MSSLDKKDRCCGRKPLVYKRQNMLFCCRCDRQYNPITKGQQENWAWLWDKDKLDFVRKSIITGKAMRDEDMA